MNTDRCDIIHETIIRDIIDVIDDVKNSDSLKGFRGKLDNSSFRSIAQASSNLTLTFPILCSRNIKIENASMVTKAQERKAVSMLQMLFTAICITDSNDVFEYIKNFHSNININNGLNVDQFIDALDKYVTKESVHISDIEMYNKVKKDLKNLNYFLPDNISESSIGSYKVIKNYRGDSIVIKEDKASQAIKNMTGAIKDINDVEKNRLIDSDVKKANELVPTMMVINFINTSTGNPIASNAVIGVKAKLYPVDSSDILSRIKIKNQDGNTLLKFIQASTREISFCRDFLFAIEKAKLDALSQSKRGSSSKMWKLLERRSLKSKARRTLGMTNDASAITTLVLSQEEVEYLKKTDNINIEDPRIIRPIMEAYNFMSVCIVDETMEVVKFIYDTGDDIYEEMSFTHLEREASDNSYKKVINLMTKMAR